MSVVRFEFEEFFLQSRIFSTIKD